MLNFYKYIKARIVYRRLYKLLKTKSKRRAKACTERSITPPVFAAPRANYFLSFDDKSIFLRVKYGNWTKTTAVEMPYVIYQDILFYRTYNMMSDNLHVDNTYVNQKLHLTSDNVSYIIDVIKLWLKIK